MPDCFGREQLTESTSRFPNAPRRVARQDCDVPEDSRPLLRTAQVESPRRQPQPLPVVRQPQPDPPRLTALTVVADARHIAGDEWWTVVDARPVTVRGDTTPANNAGEWSQIDWKRDGQPAIQPNERLLARDSVGDRTVTAQLNSPLFQKVLHVYDLLDLTCDLPIAAGTRRWKGYAGYVPANRAKVTAVTNPPNAQVWQHLGWPGSALDGTAANEKLFDVSAVGDQDVDVTLYTKPLRAVLHICQWPLLAVERITFSGGHTINNDTVADFDNEWISGRGAALQSSLCYTRNTPITLTARLRVATPPTETETVQVRATAVFGGVTLQWTSGNITVNRTDTHVAFPSTVASNNPLPNQVDIFTPVTINWEMSDPVGGWIAIGNTQHDVYVTLGNPAGTPAFLTLLHYSCTHGRTATSAPQLPPLVFAPFRTRAMQRKRDNMNLTYWRPKNTAENVGDTDALLRSTDGAGHCGSWAELLIDMLRVHGVNTGHKVNVTRHRNVVQHALPVPNIITGFNKGFLVAAWNFTPAPAPRRDRLTHTMYTDCTVGPHAPGQNNATPPPGFYNHFVVFCTSDNRIYDPSYGNDFANPNAWEQGSISGLFSDCAAPNTGYSVALWNSRLLRFHDQAAGADL